MAYEQTTKFCTSCRRDTLHTRPGTNHVLHLLVTVLLCCAWIPVWILFSLKIGGWRCQTCGNKEGCLFRLFVLIIAVFSIVIGSMIAFSILKNLSQAPHAAQGQLDKPSNEETTQLPAKPSQRVPVTPPATNPIKPPITKPKAETPQLPVRPPIDEIRTWTDASGGFKAKATYKGIAGGNVSLLKTTGEKIVIPFEKLSPDDQKWVKAVEGEP